MKSLIVAAKDFKIRFTDRRGFIMMICLPLLLTAILGSALGSVLSGSDNLPTTVIALVKEGNDPLTSVFEKEVLKSKDLSKFVSVREAAGKAAMEKDIQKGNADAGMIIPEGWSRDLKNGNLKELKVYTKPGEEIKGNIAASIAESFTGRVSTMAKAQKLVIEDLSASAAVSSGKLDMKAAAGEISGELSGTAEKDMAIGDYTTGKKSVTAMQYYAAGMAVMFLLYNAVNGAKSILQERETETLARLMMAPAGRISILLGKFYGTMFFAIIQFCLFLTATHLFFGVDWGENLAQVFAIGISYAVAVAGLSMILASVISSVKAADMVSSVGVQILAVLGGSMVPLAAFPEIMQQISNFAPNKWALSSLLDIMSGTAWSALAAPILILAGIGLVSVTIGTWRLKAR
ncbi:ABC transporter permease [Metabacillus sp. GX 13764]|uniref:ABC transporter permease n=1 Tax=Metabacillus kandeliae TaxID=2900151 RepID=UPI001E2BD141|nr:ABC transporter permease [Metabacillus kandeliae]MCD7033993.1 ABC transporter permease [Metabacillus kandeliae]